MDDVWKDISSLPLLHHPITTTHHDFQDFLAPPGGGATIHHPCPLTRPPLASPLTTMLSLSTSCGNSGHVQDPPHTNSRTGGFSSLVVKVKQTSTPEYTEKFKRLMKNRASAARSRARKQVSLDS